VGEELGLELSIYPVNILPNHAAFLEEFSSSNCVRAFGRRGDYRESLQNARGSLARAGDGNDAPSTVKAGGAEHR